MRWMCALTQIQIHYAHIYTHIHIITFNLYKKTKTKGAYDDPNGSHISIVVYSELFEGKRPVQRQQLVYKALWEGKSHYIYIYICMHFYPIIYSTTRWCTRYIMHHACIVWDVIAYLVWVVYIYIFIIIFHLTTFFYYSLFFLECDTYETIKLNNTTI